MTLSGIGGDFRCWFEVDGVATPKQNYGGGGSPCSVTIPVDYDQVFTAQGFIETYYSGDLVYRTPLETVTGPTYVPIISTFVHGNGTDGMPPGYGYVEMTAAAANTDLGGWDCLWEWGLEGSGLPNRQRSGSVPSCSFTFDGFVGERYDIRVKFVRDFANGPGLQVADSQQKVAEIVGDPLAVSNVVIEDVTDTSATVSWSCSYPAHGWIDYGPSSEVVPDVSYPLSTPAHTSSLLDFHRQTMEGLTPETDYSFRAVCYISHDGAGKEEVSEDYTFTTRASPASS
jgi:hypothetical protein